VLENGAAPQSRRRDRRPRLALVSLELDPIGAVVLRAVDRDFVFGFGLHGQPCGFAGGSFN
jgi:hypothetical protein